MNQSKGTRWTFFDKNQLLVIQSKRYLKMTATYFSRLFISCQSRDCDLQEFFRHENQSFSASLSDSGKLHTCQKSQLATILETYLTLSDTEQEAEVMIIDGSALVNSLLPQTSKTFEEYAAKDILSTVQAYSSKYKRTDIVFDI